MRGRTPITGRRPGLPALLAVALCTVSAATATPAASVESAAAATPVTRPGPAARAGQPDPAADPTAELTALVDPFVGTAPGDTDFGTGGGAGNTFPGATVPFGMVQWSPDTVTPQPGGYAHTDNRVRGFSLTHFSGAGCGAFGDIPFLPYAGTVTASPAADPGRYVSTFSHRDERAVPGYYAVRLGTGPRVELTATERTGMARFTFDRRHPASVLVDVSGSANGTDDAAVTVTGPDTVTGWASSGDFCGAGNHYRVYFAARFDRPFTSSGTWHDGTVRSGGTSARGGSGSPTTRYERPGGAAEPHGTRPPTRLRAATPLAAHPGSGAWVSFDPSADPTVTVRVGLSFVDAAGAAANLRTQGGTRGFDATRQAAHLEWNRRLAGIEVRGGTAAERTTFYTALYHVFLHPNVFSDADGRYTGFDHRVHAVAAGHVQYANFSGWDIYRSEAQLLALLAPAQASDMARSMLNQATQGGAWDRWSQANDYTGVMVGDPYQSIVASVYAFGARDFDARGALASMVAGASAATPPPGGGYLERPGLASYLTMGYVPTGEPDVWGPAATTLEYTTADFGVASLAGALGARTTEREFMRRAQFWENLFNPATGYLQPRDRDGSFGRFDPASMTGYVEGNGAQYTWMVPHDPRGLFDAMGGNAAVRTRLDRFFGKLNAGPRAPYAFLGNEPTLQTPWLYAYAGAPWRTQGLVRQAVQSLYRPTPGGYVGNDDLGEMSSWYVWAAIGMYPQVPGRAELVLASPLFPEITVHRPSGQTIRLEAPGAAATRPYVRALTVNGRPSTRAWLPADFVDTGGTLRFTLSAAPDRSWGARPADAPPSFRDGEVPFVASAAPGRALVPPGHSTAVALGARGIARRTTTVRWQAHPPAGLTVTPAAGGFELPAGGSRATRVTVAAAAGTQPGFYLVPITVSGDNGTGRRVALQVVVAAPGSPLACYDNVGLSDDGGGTGADYDGYGYSYSRQALAAAGVPAGGPVMAGMRFTWPRMPAGRPDNVAAAGQTIIVPGAPAGALSLLGSATNGPSRGTVTVTYTDGTQDRVEVGFGDWTLGAGGGTPPFGNRTVARMPYRNTSEGGRQRVATYLFATAPARLAAGRRVRSVTLPDSVDRGVMHVFAVAVGPA